jgi:hypothetical protein
MASRSTLTSRPGHSCACNHRRAATHLTFVLGYGALAQAFDAAAAYLLAVAT